MKSKWSIWGPLVFVAFLALFFVLLRNLSGDLKTLLDITSFSQNQSEPKDKDKEKADKASPAGVQDAGEPLFRGKIARNEPLEKAQNRVSGSEPDLLIDSAPFEKSASNETPISLDQNPEKSPEKTRPQENDRSKHIYFAVHYSSYRNQTDAEMEAARLSKKGLPAWWAKKVLVSKGEWFRVYIGKEETRQAAMNLALKLQEEGVIKEIRVYKAKVE
jgi:cell division protein FtsN